MMLAEGRGIAACKLTVIDDIVFSQALVILTPAIIQINHTHPENRTARVFSPL
jgi:hypothetical protein